jgi:uncharacterized protein YcnI
MKSQYFLIAVLTLPLISFAHVTMEANHTNAGNYAKLIFSVPHGCEGQATTKLTVRLPDGILSVKPQVHPGWEITTKEVKLKKPATLHGKPVSESTSEVSWQGGPLPDKYMDEFGMSILLPDRPGETLLFPVIQECSQQTSNWTEPGHDGKFPAPRLTLQGKSETGEHHHH